MLVHILLAQGSLTLPLPALGYGSKLMVCDFRRDSSSYTPPENPKFPQRAGLATVHTQAP